MSKRIEDLHPSFQRKALELIEECHLAGIRLTIIDTLRTEAEHQANLKKGVSWVKRSKHLDGLAIDVCPTVLLKEKGWAPASPLWQQLGEIGERLGLRWGGRWRVKDLGQFEAK
jgi:hypothetical protein